MDIKNQKQIASSLSIFSNTAIIILKIIAGIISGSISVISEAIHSLSDLLASILTFFAVTRSSKPADDDHPFGHGRYEDIAGFLEGLMIIGASIYITYEACKKIITNSYATFDSTIVIWVMAIAVFANIIVSNILFSVSKRTDSVALMADAKHLSGDTYSSLGVLLGLILIKITGLTLLDPIIAIFVALVILKTGASVTKETLNNLLDGTLPNHDLNIILEILDNCKDICGYKNIKSRKCGPNRDIDITILCREDMTIKLCHDICDNIEEKIKLALPNTIITIHCEPYGAELIHA